MCVGVGGAPGVTGSNVAEEVTKSSFVVCPGRNFRQLISNQRFRVNEKTGSSWKGTTEDGIRQAMPGLNMREVA